MDSFPSYWLIKTEPSCFSLEDLKKVKQEPWDGVRNYQARNMMRDKMKKGDKALFYHSNCNPPHVAGVCTIVKEGYPDHTAFIASEKHFDPKSDPENPRWFMVDVSFDFEFIQKVSLEDIKKNESLSGMKLVQKGNRLSVMPVLQEEFEEIVRMGKRNEKIA